MLIIRKIIHPKNFLNRKLQLPFETFKLCNFLIVREVAYLQTKNIKLVKNLRLFKIMAQIIVVSQLPK